MLLVLAAVAGGTAASPVAPEASAAGCPVESDAATVADPSPTTLTPAVVNETRDTTVTVGDLAVVPLALPAGENATVTVAAQANGSGTDDGYLARLRVRDDGDGATTLLVNTLVAGGRAPTTGERADGERATAARPETFAVDAADKLVNRSVTAGTPPANTSPTLAPGEYVVTVANDDDVVATRTVTVQPAEPATVTLRRGRPTVFDDATAASLAAGDGLVPLADDGYGSAVVERETLVVRIDAPGLLGAVAAQPGETATARVRHLFDRPSKPASVEIYGPCGGIGLARTADAGGIRAVTEYDRGRVTLLIDTDRLGGFENGGQTVDVDADSPRLAGALDGANASFHVASPTVEIEHTPTGPTADATLAGSTPLVPGSRVNVSLSSRIDSGLDRTATATVGPDGRFVARVNLTGASTPNVFVGRVAGDRVRVDLGDPPRVGWELDVPTAPLRPGSEIRVRDSTADLLVLYEFDPTNETYRVVDTTATDDEFHVGVDESPRWYLVVAHEDGDGDGEFDGPATDPPVRVAGSAVADWLASTTSRLDVPERAPPAPTDDRVVLPERLRESTPTSPTPSPSPTPAVATGATTPTDTATASSDGRAAVSPSTETAASGFGTAVAVGAVLAAVVGSVLVARRRQRW
ncbi:hypothetical protein [Halobaculum sp. MBLA0143]|uniref:hypothetical protein n=1 Tax=Halobaculum sp. MBLA0143 TaxID=3079933 RepID=UPI003524FF87